MSSVEPESSVAAKAAPFEGLPWPRRLWAVITLMTALTMAVLDATIAHVALPAIAADLNTTPAASIWITNAYNLALVTLLLPLSAVAERIGFRRMFTMGLTLFTVASLLCAMADSLASLTFARVLQGAGAAGITSLIGGFIRNIYPLRRLGFGMSINATTVAMSSVVGPNVGSAILAVSSWPWIFAINVPIGVLVLFGVRYLPDVPRNDVRFDVLSALLCMISLGAFIVGVDFLGQNLPRSFALFVLCGFSTVFLLRRVRLQPAPLVPIDLLRIPTIAFAAAASWATFAAQMGSYVALPFYFQGVLGRPYLEIGLLMAAWPLGTATVATLAGKVSDKYSAAVLSGCGAAAMSLGLIMLVLLPRDVSNAWVMAAMFLAGIGFGFFQTPNNRAMVGAAPRSRSGAAGGMQATIRVFGQSFGTALVAVAFSLPFGNGPTIALSFAACCAALAVVVNVVRFRTL